MELAFTKTDNLFISEFQVNSDFNLHVERDELGKFVIWVKTTPGYNNIFNIFDINNVNLN